MSVKINSEIGDLKKVIVHRPDAGIARVSPKRAEELLFDDIVFLPEMQKEHDTFTDILSLFIGKDNVYETFNLLVEALDTNKPEKAELISSVVDFEELPKKYGELMSNMDNETLAKVLIEGYYPDQDLILFDPIPNFIFTRDIAVFVKDHVIVTKAAKEARHRENWLTRFIIYTHPLFTSYSNENKIINLNHVDIFPPSKSGEVVSIEGGDVMMVQGDYLLVGCSERTTPHAVTSIRDYIFEKGILNHVVQVNIPSDRSCMHIDTLFTRIDHDTVVGYKPIVCDGHHSSVIVHCKNGSKRNYNSIKEFFLSEINKDINFIMAGDGKSPYQEREQWTDGCNLVAVKPGVGLTYDRNPLTEIAFKNAGYEVIHAHDFIESVKSGKLDIASVQKTIITLPSNELSRARGGSHCMTCPFERSLI
jgi:arginine deiminase